MKEGTQPTVSHEARGSQTGKTGAQSSPHPPTRPPRPPATSSRAPGGHRPSHVSTQGHHGRNLFLRLFPHWCVFSGTFCRVSIGCYVLESLDCHLTPRSPHGGLQEQDGVGCESWGTAGSASPACPQGPSRWRRKICLHSEDTSGTDPNLPGTEGEARCTHNHCTPTEGAWVTCLPTGPGLPTDPRAFQVGSSRTQESGAPP